MTARKLIKKKKAAWTSGTFCNSKLQKK